MKGLAINPEYIDATLEIARNEWRYNSDSKNLPEILQEFIAIGKDKGIEIDIKYGVNTREENREINTYAGFYITRNDLNKRIFIEDYIVENSIPQSEEYEKGINWFKKSINQ